MWQTSGSLSDVYGETDGRIHEERETIRNRLLARLMSVDYCAQNPKTRGAEALHF